MSYDQSQYTKDYLEGVAFGFDACLSVIRDIINDLKEYTTNQDKWDVLNKLLLELDELDAKN